MASWVAQLVRIHLQCRRPQYDSWVRKIPWRRDRLLAPVFLDFPVCSAGKESACNAGDLDLTPGLGRSPWRRAWQPTPVLLGGESHGQRNLVDYIVHGVTKSWTQLNNQAQAHNNKSIEKQVKETFSNIESELASSVIEFQLSHFKSWKMMLWKCCTQYASKFGKLSSGHRTGKGQFSFQSQRKAIPKNAQTTAQLHSSHTLVK